MGHDTAGTVYANDVRARSLVEHHPDGVFEFDLDGQFLAGNPALEALTGYSREELLGSSFVPLVHHSDIVRVTAEFEAAKRGSSRNYDMVAVRKDGDTTTVNVTNVPIVVDAEVVGVYGIARDVSEQRELTVALARSEADLRGMYEGAGTGIALSEPSGAFVRANAAYCAMLGYTEPELLALKVEQILHPDDRAANAAAVRELLAGQRDRFVAEKRFLTKHGDPIWVRTSLSLIRSPSGEPKHLVANAEDITERKRAQDHLARSESLRRIAGSVARVGGWALELATGAAFWSEEIHPLTGAQPGYEPKLSEVLEQFPQPARRRLLDALADCQTSGTPYDLELEFVTFDGRHVWTRCVGEAERDAAGRIVRLRGAMQDITPQRQAALQMEQLAERLTTTMESITDALFTLDGQWRFTYVNGRAEQLLRRTRGTLLGRNVWEEFPEAVGTRLAEAYHRAVARQITVTVDEFFFAPLDLWVEARAFPAPDGLTVYFRDISRRREVEAERQKLLAAERHARQEAEHAQVVLAHKATHDQLTGLYNRTEITSRLQNVRPEGSTVLLVDLDGFKQVNDALGRAAGDELVMNVASRLRDLMRGSDVLARTGGDEFAVLVPGHGSAMGNDMADRILETLRTPLTAAGQRLYVTASIGIAHADHTHGGEAALRNAEVALYRAKDAGRNRSIWYDPALEQQITERLATAAELHDALADDQLLLHYQPVFDLTTGRPVGAEALARWQHPERGLISPGLFIPVAEDTGLVEPLGDWCLATALETARPWTTADETFTIWVNVSVNQLRRPGLAATIERLLQATGTPPHQLGIEITESVFEADETTVLTELGAVSRLGVQVAIDDFGTGYSSLSRLADLPVDVLKIDRSFITALDSGTATVTAIVALAHAIGAHVIAEGVETDAQLAALRDSGCDHVSGFLLARPDLPSQLAHNCSAGRQLITTARPCR